MAIDGQQSRLERLKNQMQERKAVMQEASFQSSLPPQKRYTNDNYNTFSEFNDNPNPYAERRYLSREQKNLSDTWETLTGWDDGERKRQIELIRNKMAENPNYVTESEKMFMNGEIGKTDPRIDKAARGKEVNQAMTSMYWDKENQKKQIGGNLALRDAKIEDGRYEGVTYFPNTVSYEEMKKSGEFDKTFFIDDPKALETLAKTQKFDPKRERSIAAAAKAAGYDKIMQQRYGKWALFNVDDRIDPKARRNNLFKNELGDVAGEAISQGTQGGFDIVDAGGSGIRHAINSLSKADNRNPAEAFKEGFGNAISGRYAGLFGGVEEGELKENIYGKDILTNYGWEGDGIGKSIAGFAIDSASGILPGAGSAKTVASGLKKAATASWDEVAEGLMRKANPKNADEQAIFDKFMDEVKEKGLRDTNADVSAKKLFQNDYGAKRFVEETGENSFDDLMEANKGFINKLNSLKKTNIKSPTNLEFNVLGKKFDAPEWLNTGARNFNDITGNNSLAKKISETGLSKAGFRGIDKTLRLFNRKFGVGEHITDLVRNVQGKHEVEINKELQKLEALFEKIGATKKESEEFFRWREGKGALPKKFEPHVNDVNQYLENMVFETSLQDVENALYQMPEHVRETILAKLRDKQGVDQLKAAVEKAKDDLVEQGADKETLERALGGMKIKENYNPTYYKNSFKDLEQIVTDQKNRAVQRLNDPDGEVGPITEEVGDLLINPETKRINSHQLSKVFKNSDEAEAVGLKPNRDFNENLAHRMSDEVSYRNENKLLSDARNMYGGNLNADEVKYITDAFKRRDANSPLNQILKPYDFAQNTLKRAIMNSPFVGTAMRNLYGGGVRNMEEGVTPLDMARATSMLAANSKLGKKIGLDNKVNLNLKNGVKITPEEYAELSAKNKSNNGMLGKDIEGNYNNVKTHKKTPWQQVGSAANTLFNPFASNTWLPYRIGGGINNFAESLNRHSLNVRKLNDFVKENPIDASTINNAPSKIEPFQPKTPTEQMYNVNDPQTFLNQVDNVDEYVSPYKEQHQAFKDKNAAAQQRQDYLDEAFFQAGKDVEKNHFNYNADQSLTGFENDVMKRLFPFYTFQRFNMGLQADRFANNPSMINKTEAVFRNMNQETEGEERRNDPFFDDFLKNSGVHVGNGRFLNTHFNPVNDVKEYDKPLEKALNSLSPIVKAFNNATADKQLGSGYSLEGTRQPMIGGEFIHNNSPQAVNDFLGLHTNQWGEVVQNARTQNQLQSAMPQLFRATQLNKSIQEDREAVEKGEEANNAAQKMAQLFGGLATYKVDDERLQRNRSFKQQADLEQMEKDMEDAEKLGMPIMENYQYREKKPSDVEGKYLNDIRKYEEIQDRKLNGQYFEEGRDGFFTNEYGENVMFIPNNSYIGNPTDLQGIQSMLKRIEEIPLRQQEAQLGKENTEKLKQLFKQWEQTGGPKLEDYYKKHDVLFPYYEDDYYLNRPYKNGFTFPKN